jgi:hypothetical protein
MIFIESTLKVGDMVYVKTDVEQKPRMVTGFVVRQGYHLVIASMCGEEIHVFDFELTNEKGIV